MDNIHITNNIGGLFGQDGGMIVISQEYSLFAFVVSSKTD